MTHGPEEMLKEAVGGLPADYAPPLDPYLQVADGVFRRRRNRHLAVAVGAGAAVVALAAALPLTLGAGSASPAQVSPATTPTGPAAVLDGYDKVPGTVYRVAEGTTRGVHWTAGSARGAKGQSCVVSRNVLLGKTSACFADAQGARQLRWAATAPFDDRQFAVVGVAPPGVATVRVELANGAPVQGTTVGTPTSGAVRFFTVMVRASTHQQVHVQGYDRAGQPVGGPVAALSKQDFRDAIPPYCMHSGAEHPVGSADTAHQPAEPIDGVATGAPCGGPATPADPDPVSTTQAAGPGQGIADGAP
ncbi:hypothetical protein [Peterkaempfera griseoplana]|uniref:hypothetical protein n=1 Tax=Peterkaempfera griseoplana TaxID=66896 RepID=UPI0006E1E899|nr:hypothetical protein [Peterkaempfera griseoplana]